MSPLLTDTRGLPGIWRFGERLPLHKPESIVSLGEGNTPCIPLERVARLLRLRRLHAKLECLNPTGSFKDRGSTVVVSAALEAGYTELVEDSSGNAGASLAAYCARAGIKATVFVPAAAPAAKLAQVRAYGATLLPVPGTRSDVARAAREHARQSGSPYASHNLHPLFNQGMKTLAYELAEQLRGQAIDHLVVPVGNGSLLLGAWLGFGELVKNGAWPSLPRLHVVQAQACHPIAATVLGMPWQAGAAAQTVAGGIAVVEPPRLKQVADAVRRSSGTAATVAEAEILRWHGLLAQEEGVYAEPTSAAAFAGLEALVRHGTIRPDDVVVVPVTGSGLKDVGVQGPESPQSEERR